MVTKFAQSGQGKVALCCTWNKPSGYTRDEKVLTDF
jgi:hypothetical protein